MAVAQASRIGIREKKPVKDKKPTGKKEWTRMGDSPTREMLGIKKFLSK